MLVLHAWAAAQINQKLKKGDERRVDRISAENMDLSTQCLGTRPGGAIRVRAFGMGTSESDAVTDAKIRAASDVLFRGLTKGQRGCPQKPMVFDPNKEASSTTLIAQYAVETFGKNGNKSMVEVPVPKKPKFKSGVVQEYIFDINLKEFQKYFENKGLVERQIE